MRDFPAGLLLETSDIGSKPLFPLSGVCTTERAMDLRLLPVGVALKLFSSAEGVPPRENPGVEMAGDAGDAAAAPLLLTGVRREEAPMDALVVLTVSASKKASTSSVPSAPSAVCFTAIPVRLKRSEGSVAV